MAGDLPPPMTPADCDIRDFPFMPLEVQRLRKSRAWLICKRDPMMAFHMINLWTASWHEIPAASLEDDDDVLADLAMCDPKRWAKVREAALRGWVKCSDGRLYHPTVAEKALTAWQSKSSQRQRTQAARDARLQKRSDTTTECVTDAVAMSVTEVVTDTKREGEGERKGESSSLRSDATSTAKRAKARRQIASDWQPDEAGREYANARGVVADQEVYPFRNHHQAKGSVMADWSAAWRTWCDNQVKWGKAPGKPTAAAAPTLFAVTETHPAPDPWGVKAWIVKQRITSTATDRDGKPVAAINGYMVEQAAEDIAYAADLDAGWRGSWDVIAAWMRDDVGLSDAALAAIKGQAGRMRAQGQAIGSIAVFDAAVRMAARSAA